MEDDLKPAILLAIVRDYPKAFWVDARAAFRQGYLDVFHQIDADPNTVPEQRLDALYQARHFRSEYLLKTLAERHSLPASATILAANNRSYVYVAKGSIGLTQVYVQTIGAMPKPARYRERHSQMNAVSVSPQFDFIDAPKEVSQPKDFYGVLIVSLGVV